MGVENPHPSFRSSARVRSEYMLCLCKYPSLFRISRCTLHVHKYLRGCGLMLYIGLLACVLGGWGGGDKRGQSRTGMCVALLQTLTSGWHWCSHAHPSCCPPGFSAHPSSKYIPLEKPFEEIPPSPTPHTKNIQPRPPLHPPRSLAFLSTAVVYVLH